MLPICFICQKPQILGQGGFTYKPKNLFIHNKCKKEWKKIKDKLELKNQQGLYLGASDNDDDTTFNQFIKNE